MNVPIRLDAWSNKEYQKIVNSDYKYNGIFWMYQDKFINFLELIDNEFIIKKISWMENDFIMGFEGFYGYILFFKEKISMKIQK